MKTSLKYQFFHIYIYLQANQLLIELESYNIQIPLTDSQMNSRIIIIFIMLIISQSFDYQPYIQHPGQFITAKISSSSEVLNNVYVFSKYGNALTIDKHTFDDHEQLVGNISKTFNLSIQYINPTINFYSEMFSVEENRNRALFYKQNLSLHSQNTDSIMFQGVYSERHKIFYRNIPAGNAQSILYYDMQSFSPKSMDVFYTSMYPMEHKLFAGQTKLLTFYKGQNFFQIRDTHAHNVPQQYFVYQTFSILTNTYYCFCLNYKQNILYILEDNRNLIIFDLVQNDRKHAAFLNGIDSPLAQCQQTQQDIQIKFYLYSYDNLNKKTNAKIHKYSLQSNEYHTPDNFSFISYERDRRGLMMLQLHLQTHHIQIRSLNVHRGCSLIGQFIPSEVCLFCPNYCQTCSEENVCSICNSPYVLSGRTCIGYPQCMNNQYFDTQSFSCQNCLENCRICNNSLTCIECIQDYVWQYNICNSVQASTNDDDGQNVNQTDEIDEIDDMNFIEADTSELVDNLFNSSTFQLTNKIPANRQIFKVFMLFFPNIDDFWLYNYHERNYSKSFSNFLQKVEKIEKEKWNALKIIKASSINILYSNIEQLQNETNNKKPYSKSKFIEKEGKGQTLLTNCFYYLTVNFALSILMFLVLKLVFRILYNYRVSRIFRPYSFWGYIGVIMIDGNSQIIYFLMFAQSQLLFSFNFRDKLINTLEQILFFMYLFISVSCYFLYFHFYKKLSKYFIENSQSTVDGILSLTLNCSFRQICLAAIHNFARYDPSFQNLMLIGVQVFFILFNILYSDMSSKFKQFWILWVSMIFSFLRINLNIMLYFEFKNLGDQGSSIYFDKIVQIILYAYLIFYMFSILLSILINVGQGIYGLVEYFISKRSQPKLIEKQSEKLKQLSQNVQNQQKLDQNIQTTTALSKFVMVNKIQIESFRENADNRSKQNQQKDKQQMKSIKKVIFQDDKIEIMSNIDLQKEKQQKVILNLNKKIPQKNAKKSNIKTTRDAVKCNSLLVVQNKKDNKK